jgi:flagellar basal-body rod protein FlgG
LEIGSAGLESSDQKVRKLMDNMVNSEVPGYKKSDAVVRAFPLELAAANQRIGAMRPQVEGSYHSDLPGALIKTNGALDLALGSEGYFILSGPWGEGYTRDGRFRLDRDGRLLSVSGNFPVLGQHGQVVIPEGAEVSIDQNGVIKADGVEIDRLRIAKTENNKDLVSLNGSLFRKQDPQATFEEVEAPRIVQGYIEASNVNIVDQMMEMITLERLYTVNSKVIQARDTSLAKAMELGKPSQ